MKKRLILISVLLLLLTLALCLSGCAGGQDDFNGKNIVTFEINGGVLSYGTSSTSTKINFVYHPGTYIVDPTELPNYSISKNGYNFTGWYTSSECKPSDKWDFGKTFDEETLTLYAGWERAIKYSYTVYYMDGETPVSLGSYSVSSGAKFDDWRKFAATRKNFTCIGFYSDPDLTEAWDVTTTHPGGNVDLDIPVYAKYIEGDWVLVDNYDKLKNAMKQGNVYLTADVDCEGKELSMRGTFDKIFEGNGYTVKNFTVSKFGTIMNPACAIFETLGANAEIRNVTFEGASYNFTGILANDKVKVKFAALAINANEGAKISSVSISGTLTTDYSGSLTRLDIPFWYEEGETPAALAGVTDFSATITVNQ